MTTGEWAVSTDEKYVRMCFSPGLCLRMATYEAFEEDMREIQLILATCQDIQVAVEEFNRLAAQHENNAKIYASQAELSKTAAENSATAAKTSETNAKASETAAKASQTAAKTSETNAAESAESASFKATAAENSATAAKTSETNAKASETAAKASASDAAGSATIATNKANAALQSAEESADSALLSESWAVGNTGIRDGEDTNNSKYWSELAQRVVESAGEGGIIPVGTITFSNLPTSGMKTGYMYNISDAFTSDARFEDGGGLYYAAGANVYYTAGGKWDVLTGVQVTGVKGNAESTYRRGNVNLTPANIGAVNKSGDTMTGSLSLSGAGTAIEFKNFSQNGCNARGIFFFNGENNMDGGMGATFCSGILEHLYIGTGNAPYSSNNALIINRSALKWKGSNVVTEDSGNAPSATKSMQDGDGNQISTTYVKSSKIVKSTNITEDGFLMDGKAASVAFAELNRKLGADQSHNSNPQGRLIGTYDGKQLYEVTVTGDMSGFVNSGNFVDVTISHGISNINSVIGVVSSKFGIWMGPYIENDVIATMVGQINASNIVFRNKAVWGKSYKWSVTFQYTLKG